MKIAELNKEEFLKVKMNISLALNGCNHLLTMLNSDTDAESNKWIKGLVNILYDAMNNVKGFEKEKGYL